jgi:hypothetical protein
MIDRTNLRIKEMEEEILREQERRYSFHRMVRATDGVLWRLEELNRDGVKTVDDEFREEIREVVATMPGRCQDQFQDSPEVQTTLDGIFAVQECLFKWRYPEWAGEEDDDLVRAS